MNFHLNTSEFGEKLHKYNTVGKKVGCHLIKKSMENNLEHPYDGIKTNCWNRINFGR